MSYEEIVEQFYAGPKRKVSASKKQKATQSQPRKLGRPSLGLTPEQMYARQLEQHKAYKEKLKQQALKQALIEIVRKGARKNPTLLQGLDQKKVAEIIEIISESPRIRVRNKQRVT